MRQGNPWWTGDWQIGGATGGAGVVKKAPFVKEPNPLSRPALRDGVVCGGAQKAPPLYPAPKSTFQILRKGGGFARLLRWLTSPTQVPTRRF